MTETIDTTKFRALAEAADAQPYNIHAVAEYRQFLVFTLSPRPDKVVALLDRLAAAEARNATLTDDAARYRWLRTWTRGVRAVEFGCADFAFPKIRVAAGVNVMRGAVCQHLDAAIDAELARAAASISTKGDGHG